MCIRDSRGAVAVSDVVLNDQHRPHTALFRAYYRAEIGVVDLSPFYGHVHHSPWLWAGEHAARIRIFNALSCTDILNLQGMV